MYNKLVAKATFQKGTDRLKKMNKRRLSLYMSSLFLNFIYIH